MHKPQYFVRKLAESDVVKSFKVGNAAFLPLKTFLQKQAHPFQQASIAQTYVAVTDDGGILGYVTLTCSEIDLRDGYHLDDCSHASNYEYLPAVKIARLAVDDRYRGSGIGSTLVNYALAVVLDKIAENVGCRFVVTDAKQGAVDFYQKQGFTLLDSESNQVAEHKLMFLDLMNLA